MSLNNSSLFLGVDIGTQSIKVCVFDTKGEILARVVKPQYLKAEKPGWAEENPKEWWHLTSECIKKVVSDSKVKKENIKGIAVDAVMHSPVAIDKEGNLVEEKAQLYCDKRTVDIVTNMCEKDPEDRFQNITGNPAAPHLMGIKIKWIKENQPEVYSRTWKYVSAKDYINYVMTGEIATDYSEASGSGLFDAEKEEWSPIVIQKMGLDFEKFPKIYKSSDVIGYVRKSIAKELNLSEKVAVVCGGGDMLCALLGAGVVKRKIGFDITGTGSIVGMYTPTPIVNPNITNLRHVKNEGWVPYCCIDSSGGGFRWVRDVLCKKEMEEAVGNVYDYLTKFAKEIPYGADGVMFFPYLQGLREKDMLNSKGVFLGMTTATKTGHLIRATMEGIAFEHKRYYEWFDLYEKTERIVHTGGAANSPFWCQIKADIYNKELVVPAHEECAALGAAMLAMIGTGEFKNENEVEEISLGKVKSVYEPNMKTRSRYEAMFEVFKNVHDVLKTPFSNLSEIMKKGE